MDEYKIGEKIGSGAFSEVFKGTNIKTGMKVAIKIIRKKRLYENGNYLLKAFEREIDCMNKCACENSIKFIKQISTEKNLNIIMELCDMDLLCYLYERSDPFSVEEIKETFSQLNNAFRKLSQNHIVHRDLKLGNILIKFTDESKTKFIPKISDYGFSKELNEYNYLDNTHLGTPATMAPELLVNQPYNEKSDLWSVGVMMYQLYFKEIPYEGNNENEILQKIQSNIPFKQPSDPKFKDLINKLLVFNVQNRLSWEEYFNHPFFTGKDLEESKNEKDSQCFCNSFFMSELSNSFENKKSPEKKFLSHSLNESEHDNNFFVQGDIYGKTDIYNSNNLSLSHNFASMSLYDEENVVILNRGAGINNYECEIISNACVEVEDNNCYPISHNVIKIINYKLKGEWMVIVCPENEFNYDFFLTFSYIQRYVILKYKGNIFHVCQLI